jgi:hypothetical protein
VQRNSTGLGNVLNIVGDTLEGVLGEVGPVKAQVSAGSGFPAGRLSFTAHPDGTVDYSVIIGFGGGLSATGSPAGAAAPAVRRPLLSAGDGSGFGLGGAIAGAIPLRKLGTRFGLGGTGSFLLPIPFFGGSGAPTADLAPAFGAGFSFLIGGKFSGQVRGPLEPRSDPCM